MFIHERKNKTVCFDHAFWLKGSCGININKKMILNAITRILDKREKATQDHIGF